MSTATAGLTTQDATLAALSQLSGEIYASAQSTLIEEGRFLRGTAIDRIRAAFNTVGAGRGSVVAFPDPPPSGSSPALRAAPAGVMANPVIVPSADQRFAVWTQALGAWGTHDGDGNAAGVSRSTNGILAGVEASVLDWRVGMIGGRSETSFDVADRASYGRSDNYHVGLYAGKPWQSFDMRAGATYSWHSASTQRTVAFGSFSDSVTGAYQARSAQVFGEIGRGFKAGPVSIEPFANVAYVNLQNDPFVETGGAAALTGQNARVDAAFATLGLRGASTFTLAGIGTTLTGTLQQHALGETTPHAALAFAGGTPFTVAGVPTAREAFTVDAGVDLALLPRGTFGVSYGGQFASGSTDQSVKGNLAFNW